MALVPLSALTATPPAIRPTAPVTFTIRLMDPIASAGQQLPHQLTLTIAPDVNYTFAGGSKSVTRPRGVGLDTMVSLPETVQGVDDNAALFNVIVADETATPLGAVLVAVLAAPVHT